MGSAVPPLSGVNKIVAFSGVDGPPLGAENVALFKQQGSLSNLFSEVQMPDCVTACCATPATDVCQ